ncbi:MAG: MarR family winged helix-turn-helix transcriptional regulator [Planctomycetaceae bacterium]
MPPANLRDQLKKRGPFASLEQESLLSILRTSDLLENRLARLLREYELTPSQYNAMRIMRGENKPLPCLEVASRMIQVAPAITRVIDQLVSRELVEKIQSADDRRVFLVALAPEGSKLLRKLDRPIERLEHSLLGSIPKAELQKLNQVLELIRTAVDP